MPKENRCQFCKGLYSLGAECLVVTLTFVHAVMSAVEILIHLDVIHVPNSTKQPVKSDSSSFTDATPTSTTHDPGGCFIDLHDDLVIAVEILRYATLVISALFLIEITCKIMYLKKQFFKDGWQIFDLTVVIVSIGVEVSFFLIHEELYCYHAATEAATFIVLLRLWRIPRACNVRKKELKMKYDNEIRYNTQTKVESEKAQRQLEKRVEYLETVLINNNLLETKNLGAVEVNNTHGQNGVLAAAKRAIHSVHETDEIDNHTPNGTKTTSLKDNGPSENSVAEVSSNNRQGTDLARNDSDKNSGGNDSGIEVKDSFKSDRNDIQAYRRTAVVDDDVFESDGSEMTTRVEEVEVQIEEPSRQRQLPSITSYRRSMEDDDDDVVLLRRKQSSGSAAYCVNPGFETPDPNITHESITYTSAEGEPMTDL